MSDLKVKMKPAQAQDWLRTKDRLTAPEIKNGELLSSCVDIAKGMPIFFELVEALSEDSPALRWALAPVLEDDDASAE